MQETQFWLNPEATQNLLNRAMHLAMEDRSRLILIVVLNCQQRESLQRYILGKSSGLCLLNIRVKVLDETFDWDTASFPGLPSDTVVLLDRMVAEQHIKKCQSKVDSNMASIVELATECRLLGKRIGWLQKEVL